jgi:hypothetical protein
MPHDQAGADCSHYRHHGGQAEEIPDEVAPPAPASQANRPHRQQASEVLLYRLGRHGWRIDSAMQLVREKPAQLVFVHRFVSRVERSVLSEL